jgi:hypothetical protein
MGTNKIRLRVCAFKKRVNLLGANIANIVKIDG